MIYGVIVKCEGCGNLFLEKLDAISHEIQGNKIVILDCYVCNTCISRNAIELQRARA